MSLEDKVRKGIGHDLIKAGLKQISNRYQAGVELIEHAIEVPEANAELLGEEVLKYEKVDMEVVQAGLKQMQAGMSLLETGLRLLEKAETQLKATDMKSNKDANVKSQEEELKRIKATQIDASVKQIEKAINQEELNIDIVKESIKTLKEGVNSMEKCMEPTEVLTNDQECVHSIARTAQFSIEIDEYLFFLKEAISIVDSHFYNSNAAEEFHLSPNKNFIEFYNTIRDSYSKIESKKLTTASVLPIFSGHIYINVEKAKIWEEMVDKDIKEFGTRSVNGYEVDYLNNEPHILSHHYKSFIDLFTNPDIYSVLREKTINSVKKITDNSSEEEPSVPLKQLMDKLKSLASYCEKIKGEEEKKPNQSNDSKSDNKEKKKESKGRKSETAKIYTLKSEWLKILDICDSEIQHFSSKYLKGVFKEKLNSLTARERVFLTAYRLYNDGYREIGQTNLARAIAIEYDKNEGTYLKVLKNMYFSGYNIKKLPNLEGLVNVLNKGASNKNLNISKEKYEDIKAFTYKKYIELLGEQKEE